MAHSLNFSGRRISPSQKFLSDNSQHLQETDSHSTGGIRTRNLSKRTAAKTHLRSRGNRDRANKSIVTNMATMRDFEHIFEVFNPLNPELNPICYLLALLGAHHFLNVSRIRVKLLTFKLLMSYIYGAPILDVSRSHTTTQHSR